MQIQFKVVVDKVQNPGETVTVTVTGTDASTVVNTAALDADNSALVPFDLTGTGFTAQAHIDADGKYLAADSEITQPFDALEARTINIALV